MTIPEPTADELEKIRRLSQQVAWWDSRPRWRRVVAAALLAFVIVMVVLAVQLLVLLGVFNPANVGFLTLLVAFLIGWKISSLVQSFGSVALRLVWGPYRNERLLVKYYESLLHAPRTELAELHRDVLHHLSAWSARESGLTSDTFALEGPVAADSR